MESEELKRSLMGCIELIRKEEDKERIKGILLNLKDNYPELIVRYGRNSTDLKEMIPDVHIHPLEPQVDISRIIGKMEDISSSERKRYDKKMYRIAQLTVIAGFLGGVIGAIATWTPSK